MGAESGLLAQYTKQYLERDLKGIFEKQRTIASARAQGGKSRGAQLRDALEHTTYTIAPSGAGVWAEVKYPLALRFMDMKHIGNWRIYDRVVWKTIYGRTLQDLKYEYGDWLRRQLQAGLGQGKNT